MKKIILFLAIFITFQQLSAQENQFKKNAIYGSIGNAGLYFTATAYYERIIKQEMWEKNISSFVNLGYGGQAYWGGEGSYFLARYGIITGVKTHHLEGSLGILYGFDGYQSLRRVYRLFENTTPSGSIGWRRQKFDKNFLIRAGLGFPETIYFGIGVAF